MVIDFCSVGAVRSKVAGIFQEVAILTDNGLFLLSDNGGQSLTVRLQDPELKW